MTNKTTLNSEAELPIAGFTIFLEDGAARVADFGPPLAEYLTREQFRPFVEFALACIRREKDVEALSVCA